MRTGGIVIITAKAADDPLASQVNNEGLIQAQTIDDLKGTITLVAENGTTAVSGTLDASAPASGDGGFIETSGNNVIIEDDAVITTRAANGATGTWLIDPTNFTVVSGSAFQTTSGMGADTLEANLAATNVSITTASAGTEDGDINIDADVSWSADTTLTLTAANDINVNDSITASGENAGLDLTAGTDINVNAPVTLSGTNAAMAMTYGGRLQHPHESIIQRSRHGLERQPCRSGRPP